MRSPRTASGLTASQHRIIRRLLALIPAFVWLAYVWPVFFTQLPDASNPAVGHYIRDFLHFYTQGMAVREHDRAALYDINRLAQTAERAAPEIPKQLYPPVYGPQVGFVFAPFTALPYVTALYLWLFTTIAVYVACVYAIWREHDALRHEALPIIVLALGAPGLHFTLSFGQASVIGLICFTMLWKALRRQRMFEAGVALGALAYKPPLAVVAAVVFVYRREWRVVAGAGVAVGVQFLLAALYWGPGVFIEYVRAIGRLPQYLGVMEPHPELAQTIRATFTAAGLAGAVAVAATLTVSAAIIGLAVWAWRNDTREAGFIAMGCATLLVDPHFYAYDLIVLTPVLLLALERALSGGERYVGWAALAVYVAPIVSMVGVWPRAPWILLALALLFGASVAAAARERRRL